MILRDPLHPINYGKTIPALVEAKKQDEPVISKGEEPKKELTNERKNTRLKRERAIL